MCQINCLTTPKYKGHLIYNGHRCFYLNGVHLRGLSTIVSMISDAIATYK